MDITRFREAIRPQDGFAILITVLGVAGVIFLPDSITKLIGGSIAIFGAVALYLTVKQRVDDQVQIRSRRTTLPTPAFKTRVTQDSGSSTKRILFDDFKETFDPADDDIEVAADPGESFRVMKGDRNDAPAQPSAPAAPTYNPSSRSREERGRDEDVDVFTGEEGSFRVIRAAAPEAAPAAESASSRQSDTSTLEAVAAPPDERIEPMQITAPVEEIRSEPTLTRKQVQMILEDLVSDGEEEGRAGEPRAEFVRLVAQVLNAIARSIPARSIVYFWVNLEKGHSIPEATVSTSSVEIRSGARLPIGNDVIAQIARSGIPEILTDISSAAERELIPYYVSPAGTQSFVGVPVFFRREVVGVLAADSGEPSGFDESSVATLAEYTRLISGLIRGYTEKYDLHLTARTLDAFEALHRAYTGRALAPFSIAGLLVDQISSLFDNNYVAALLFDPEQRAWRVVVAGEEGMTSEIERLTPDINGSLLGHATRFAEEIYIEQLDREIRFNQEESLDGRGSFVALPLIGTTKCYGAVAIECSAPSAYIARDIELLRDLVRYAALAVEVYNVNQAFESQSVVDETTGLFNVEFLLSTLDRELIRARDHNAHLSFALVSIDMPASLNVDAGGEIEETIVSGVASAIAASLRPYDSIGRYDRRTFGVVLVERNDQSAYLWGEKLRKEVAGRIMAAGGRKFSVTVSTGICDRGEFTNGNALVDGATQALRKAATAEGNSVVLF